MGNISQSSKKTAEKSFDTLWDYEQEMQKRAEEKMKKKLPKCKQCGDRFYPFNNNSLQKYCMKKDECIKAHADKVKETKRKQQSKNRKALNKTREDNEKSKRIADLQVEVNSLVRKIDLKFNLKCVCCDKPFTGQIDAAHFHSRGSDQTIRFHLDNIHASRAHCNQHKAEHHTHYKENLKRRYGEDYYNKVVFELKQIPPLHLTLEGVKQALKKVRKINREFDNYKLKSPILAREKFNKEIGLYT